MSIITNVYKYKSSLSIAIRIFFFNFPKWHILDLTIFALPNSIIRQTHSYTNEVNVHKSISGEYLHIYSDDEKPEFIVFFFQIQKISDYDCISFIYQHHIILQFSNGNIYEGMFGSMREHLNNL